MAQLYDDKYEFIEEIGKGGFGRVFKARERITERHVAIKELHDKVVGKQQLIVRELKTIAQFQRERVVAYFNHFYQEEKLFLVMEYCPNGNLKEYYKEKKIPGGAVNNVIKGVAKELHFIHSNNVIHRDIKPANLLVSDSNMVKIADFGIANTLGGTPPYMSPEALQGDIRSMNDPRVDIYALGVTMMELLTGKNPFYYLSPDQILALHEKGDFPINNLPQWQQEVILKAIHKEPELRFQTMKEFAEAIRAKHAPFILNQDMLKAGEIAASAEKLLGRKKWIKAIGLLDHGEAQYPESVKILKLKADYLLRSNKIKEARTYYEKALKLNPRMNIHKELGSIYLEEGVYPKAISMLSDHLYKEPSDLEAYNLLLKSYYETGRYDAGMDLAEMILREHPDHPCFINNHFVCNFMLGKGKEIPRRWIDSRKRNPFWLYNLDLYTEEKVTHNYMKEPTIKSKLLFMDYRFSDLKQSKLYILEKGNAEGLQEEMSDFIIPIGRKGYTQNTVQIPGGTKCSRRHCVIINSKFDTWLIDLNSTGTYVSGKKVEDRVQLIGVQDIRIVDTNFRLSTDKERLL